MFTQLKVWKILLLMIAISGTFITSSSSQHLRFDFIDGSNLSFTVASIESVAFENQRVDVVFNDGSTFMTNMSMVADYKFGHNVLGINDAQGHSTVPFSIYPNPTSGTVSIETEKLAGSEWAATVFNLQGKQVRFWPILNQPLQQWDCTLPNGERLVPGIYIVRLVDASKKTYSRRLIIQ